MSVRKTYRAVTQLQKQFEAHKGPIRSRLDEFARVPSGDLFYELAYCLLTPQSSAINAGKAVDAFKAAGFLHKTIDPVPLLFSKAHYIRFHNIKGRHLLQAKTDFMQIQQAINNGLSSDELRMWLVKNVRGFGLKEASHFLRNIGHRNLAILDRHILRNLKKHGVLSSLPKTLTSKHYFDIERKFKQFADAIGITMDELDLLFWSNETGTILK